MYQRGTVTTASGTRYVVRVHGERTYVSRQGTVNVFAPPELQPIADNRVMDTADLLIVVGKHITFRFRDGYVLRTTEVLSYTWVTYPDPGWGDVTTSHVYWPSSD
jgi:hypothetical protein